MTSSYEYVPYIWPVLSSAAFLAPLAIYGIRHPNAPGAGPFIILVLGIILLVLCPVPQPVPSR